MCEDSPCEVSFDAECLSVMLRSFLSPLCERFHTQAVSLRNGEIK